MKTAIVGAITYVVVAFLTYGYAYNNADPYRTFGEQHRQEMAALDAVFWPFYWASYPIAYAGRLAVEVTK
jgi:hypothetical protein